MPRYIDAEKLMLSLMTDPVGRMLIREYNVDKFIEAQPTAEVGPVKIASLLDPNPYGKCSVCGYLIDVREGLNYCPRCGSKLDKSIESKLDIAKRIIKENIADGRCGLFDIRNIAGDAMVPLYDEDGLKIDICYYWEYFEVFGLSKADFTRLGMYYNDLCNSNGEEE